MGYDPGPIDGQYGSKTAAAVKAFQRDAGFSQDGWIDQDMLSLLEGIASASIDYQTFIEKSTSFVNEFMNFRSKRFALGEEVFGIDDSYAPVNWPELTHKAKLLVENHERLMINFVEESKTAIAKLEDNDVIHGTIARRTVLEFIDSVGKVVLKLYEITSNLSKRW